MQAAAIILLLAALGGMTVAAMRLTGTPRPPTWLALAHGAVAATGLGTLLYAAATETIPLLAQVSLGIFLLAALGGAAMFLLFHLKEKPLPIPLMLGHGAAALTAYVLLLVAIFA